MIRRQARLAQDFAAALEGRGVASARRDPMLAPLLGVADGLRAVPLTAPADFRDALRTRLLAVATVAPQPLPQTSPVERARTWVEGWRVQKALAAMSASMAGVVALTGVSVAASRSLPGDPLYGVKRTAEGVQVSLARNDVNRGKRHLQHAETRLNEIARVVGTDLALAPGPVAPGQITVAFGGSRSARVGDALRSMDEETRAGTDLLFDAYVRDHDEQVLRAIRDFSGRQRQHLGDVLGSLPADAQDDAAASIALVTNLSARAYDLLAAVASAEPAPAPAPDTVVGEPLVTPTPTPTMTPAPQAFGPPAGGDTVAVDEPPVAAEPTEDPTDEATEEPTEEPSEEPAPTSEPSHYPLPSQIPSPVASPIQTVIDDANDQLPTPLPTPPPLPGTAAPLVPGAGS